MTDMLAPTTSTSNISIIPMRQEREVMPGVYVSDPPPALPEPPLLDNLEHLREEIARLRRSVEMLLNSNRELQPHANDDSEFAQAIAENVGVIARQIAMIQKYEARMDVLTGAATHEADKPCKRESLPIVVTRPTAPEAGNNGLVNPPPQASAQQTENEEHTIRRVTVNGIEAKYGYDDPLTPIVPPSARKTAQHHNEYRQQYIYALQEADEGELVVDLPAELKVAEPLPTLALSAQGAPQEDPLVSPFTPLRSVVIRVDYSLRDPRAGIHFVLPESVRTLERYPHMYTHNQASSARLWMPCFDRQQEQCTWSIDIIVPRKLSDVLPSLYEPGVVHEIDPDTDIQEGDRDMLVVCSGQLDEEFVHPTEPGKKISRFSVTKPASACSIILAIGPFHALPVPGWMSKEVEDEESAHGFDELGDDDGPDGPALLRDEDAVDGAFAFCLPGREEHVEYTIHFVAQVCGEDLVCVYDHRELSDSHSIRTVLYEQALAFFEQYLGAPYPHSSYKQVFLEDVYNPVSVGTTIAIFSTDLLLNGTVIDQTYETTRLLCRALVAQWFGLYIVPKTWADAWLMVGLTNYLVGLFMQRSFGKNEHKFRLQKDMQRVCDLDVNQPPVYPTLTDDTTPGEHPSMIDPLILQHFHPDDDWASVRSEFISLKAPIVLYMLDRRMGKGMLRKVIGKLLYATASGELPNGLSTHHFLRLARKMTGKLELKVFADQWIYGSGCPRFNFKYNFNRKKMVVEFRFWQDNTNGWIVGSTPKFTGPFMIRIHEPGGTYDTEVHIEDAEKQYDIQYHTKYKRIRRKPVPAAKGKKGEAENGAGEEHTMPLDEKANDAGDSKMEWNDEEPDRLDFEWIRLDPDNDWLCVTTFEQSDYMWAAQLRKDKNVDAQLEAIEGLHQLPSLGTCNVLFAFVIDKTAFYGLRMEAAYALAKCVSELGSEALEKYLLKPYRDKYCLGIDDATNAVYPKCHDFTELQEYYLKKAAISAISLVRLSEELAPVPCRRLLLDLLKYNDNTGNTFSDNYFVANLLTALGNAFLPAAGRTKKRVAPKPTGPLAAGDVEEFSFGGESEDESFGRSNGDQSYLFAECLAEIHRYRVLDRLIPSYHNSVTIACLEVLLKWMLASLIPVDLSLFLQHSRYQNFLRVRLVALDALFLLDGLSSQPVANFLLDLVADDPVPYVRYHVAKAMAEFVEVLAAESTSLIERNEALSSSPENLARVTSKWDAIRVRIAAREEVAQRVWDMMNSRSVLDHRVRFNLLRFCEYLYDAAAAPPPRLRIKVAPRRVVDDSASEDEGVAATALPKRILLIGSGAAAKAATSRARAEDRNQSGVPRPTSVPLGELREPDPIFRATCSNVLTRLRNHPSSASFVLPVDTNNKSYYEIIKRPMDLHTAGRNVEAGYYGDDLDRFLADVRQIFKNCYEYNLEESNVYRQAKKLEQFLESAVVPEARATLKASTDARAKAPSPEPNAAPLPPLPQVSRSSTPMPANAPPAKTPAVSMTAPVRSRSATPVPAPSSVSKAPVTTGAGQVMSTSEINRCKRVWKTLRVSPYGHWFAAPVDPIALGIPTYLQVVKKPMDLQTIRTKLESGTDYGTPKAFEADVRLMLSNSLRFNPPDTAVHRDTRAMLALFDKEWESTPKASRESSPTPTSPRPAPQVTKDHQQQHQPPQPQSLKRQEPAATPTPVKKQPRQRPVESTAAMASAEVNRCDSALTAMEEASQFAAPFRFPVSKVLYPEYHRDIKQPMDLSTIRERLNKRDYKSLDQFEADVRLMFRNCYTFNRVGEPVYAQGKALEALFDAQWSPASSLRKDSAPKASGHPEAVQAAHSPAVERRRAQPQSSSKARAPAISAESVSSTPSRSVSPAMPSFSPEEQKMCADVLKSLSAHPSAAPFLLPVDPVALNIPNYPLIVKRPMDISTIRKKLHAQTYPSADALRDDFHLMLNNCFKFNQPGDWVSEQGRILETQFETQWEGFLAKSRVAAAAARGSKSQASANASSSKNSPRPQSSSGSSKIARDSPAPTPSSSKAKPAPAAAAPSPAAPSGDGLTSAQRQQKILGVVSKLQHFEHANIFLQPVDPAMFPDYRTKIRKPMDLATMERRARSGEYATLREFESDFRLMIANCFAYNPKTSFGHNCGLATEKFFNREWKAILDARDENKKRKKEKDGSRTGGDDANMPKRKRDTSETLNPAPPARKKAKQEPPAAGTPTPLKLKFTIKK
ncbi:hypothetical protein HDU86_001372 [Geranomyces michiganensis]|nr:hypothetical protein HDU86_001372 [Geranomyces michiganensis]